MMTMSLRRECRRCCSGVRWAVIPVLAICLHGATAVSAAIGASLALPTLFSDGMVVQRGAAVQIWGWARPGATVTIDFAGQTISARADDTSTWRAEAAPVSSHGPHTMRVRSGDEESIVRDILAGEVWLCSGQSNMAMSLPELGDSAGAVMAEADHPHIRMFRVPESPADEPWKDVPGASWKPCTPVNARRYSAFAYFFARRFHHELDAPIGIVLSAWGGSSTVAWTSREALDAPQIRRQVPYDVLGWGDMIRPSRLTGAMLDPLAPYTVRGTVWYQGETEAAAGQNPYLYRLTFPAMIEDWRRQWRRPEMPFYFVQLPTLRSGHRWPAVRESQRQALRLPRTGMITTLDLGEPNHLHPLNKQAFAERMADLVLAREYGRGDVAVDGPRFREARVEGSQVRVTLDHASGLRTSDGQPPREFTIAGQDQKFFDAAARIEQDGTLLVTSDQVPAPASVRYGWSAEPKVNIVNAAGLPLEPFRSDDWPVDGQELMWQTLPGRDALARTASAAAMISGEAGAWRWAGDGQWRSEGDKQRFTRPLDGGRTQLVIRQTPRPGVVTTTPAAWWTAEIPVPTPAPDAKDAGFTAEIRAAVYRATMPLSGLEFEVCHSGRRYRIAVAPTHLYGYHGNEIRILGQNLDNCTDYHDYRISIRPDGTAQVYFDSRELGVLAGEPLPDGATSSRTSIGWGKRAPGGEMTVNVHQVAFDGEGAFEPGD